MELIKVYYDRHIPLHEVHALNGEESFECDKIQSGRVYFKMLIDIRGITQGRISCKLLTTAC